jgi:hypothetical protein
MNEAKELGYKSAMEFLVSLHIPAQDRKKSEHELDRIIMEYGPVVDSYPSWHPLVARDVNSLSKNNLSRPSELCDYRGLDHTIYLAHGFITCPYENKDKTVIKSIDELRLPDYFDQIVEIKYKRLDFPFYSTHAKPILVYCDWKKSLNNDQTIPTSLAIPLMLEQELPGWRWSEVGETWETMRSYLLGTPHGKRSSLFINDDTAIKMKKIYTSLTETGMYGPIMVGR